MKINIQTVHFSMNSNLQKYIEKRLSKLNLYYNRIVSVDLYLNLDNHNDQTNKSVELRVNIPGDDVVVGKKSESFEKSLDMAASSAERMLKRRKEKSRIS
ncbi:MAG: ribosome hibernation-promoting factor, HPF/YfiA family [Flavobacteriaceae bacterium]|jgi:putative sigma-54 modulation protein|tara:strand:+ start:538 stop:837 length:300 start_codon:yes stop_codon:yes gene_type:complete